MIELSQEDFENNLEQVLLSAYNSAFVGLRNSEIFTFPIEYYEIMTATLESLNIRFVSVLSQDEKKFTFCCFTTGIQTDRPFDSKQI